MADNPTTADPVETKPAKAKDWSVYRRLLGYIADQKLWFLLAMLGFLLVAVGEAGAAATIGKIIDALKGDDAGLWGLPTWIFAVAIFILAVVRGVGAVSGEYLMARISFRAVHRIRCDLFDKLLVLPSAFFDKSTRGHLVSRLTYTSAEMRDSTSDALKIIVQDGLKVIVYFSAMVYYNPLLTAIFVVVAPFVAWIVHYASRRFRRISTNIQQSMGDVTHVASEAASGYREMRTFGGEEYEKHRFYDASTFNRRQNLKLVATKTSSAHLIQILVAACIAGLVAVLFLTQLATPQTAGDFVAYITLAGMLANPIKKLSDVNARLQRGLAAATDVFSQLDQPAEEDTGTLDIDRVRGEIRFDNVSFHYQDHANKPVLSDVSFTIEPGQTVALVGRSGAGKSTLASLIARFYEVEQGHILIDSHPIADLTRTALRRQIALVSQDVMLFNDTLRNNIAYGGLSDASEEAVALAARRAHADEFVRALPKGLETVVGDSGVLLSGGQRQRVAIARALLKDAPILILDEATSALDTESEQHIQAALEEVMRDRTTIVIAHRLSTIENADVIMVMDGGRIVETGTHAELMQRQGAYARLYESRLTGEEAMPRRTTRPDASLPVAAGDVVPALGPVQGLADAWYGEASTARRWLWLLAPLAWLFRFGAARRERRFRTGKREVVQLSKPVIVAGNITVGGSGKSPLVIWLAQWLQGRGLRVGIVSRGYRGRGPHPLWVDAETPAFRCGDEAALIARRTGCPVVVDPDRARAARLLIEREHVDVIIADDGLQHYRLARTVEIAVIDGLRGVGNGRFLPAGPLREPVSRLKTCDWVVANEHRTGLVEDESVMVLQPKAFVNVLTGERMPPGDMRGRSVMAIAAIGNPARFAATLARLGLNVPVRAYPDHYAFKREDLLAPPGVRILMTEKDAQKVKALDGIGENCWYLEVEMQFTEPVDERLQRLLISKGVLPEPSPTELSTTGLAELHNGTPRV